MGFTLFLVDTFHVFLKLQATLTRALGDLFAQRAQHPTP
jgi:hypothetical protein